MSGTLTLERTIVLLITLFTGISVSAQWEEDVRLTHDPAVSLPSNNNAWSIAAEEGLVHATWFDTRDGNTEIYYKRSENGGNDWSEDVRISNAPLVSWYPCIAVSGLNVHLVWADSRDGNGYEIYYCRSTDGGLNWGPNTRITFEGTCQNPSLKSFGDHVHIIWEDFRAIPTRIYHRHSSDNGASWGDEGPVSYRRGVLGSIAVTDNRVHTVWQNNDTLFYAMSLNHGTDWEEAQTILTGSALAPCISASENAIHMTWYSFDGDQYVVYHCRSDDGGINWSTPTPISGLEADARYPSVCAKENHVYVCWNDERDDIHDIYLVYSADNGQNWNTEQQLTLLPGFSQYASAAVSETGVHVIWMDDRAGNMEIYYKHNSSIHLSDKTFQSGSDVALIAHPNPFRYAFQLDGNFQAPVQVITYNSLGTVIQRDCIHSPVIDGSAWAGGIYLLHAEDATGLVWNIRVLKE